MYDLRFTIYDGRIRKAVMLLLVSALGAAVAGCNNKFLDPAQIGRFRPTPAVNVILNSLGVAEEAPVAWESAEDPQPGDIMALREDCVFRPGDVVRISIFELFQEGVPVVNDYIISETGKISIPEVNVVQAAGLTERQLEDEIKRILSPNILRDPSVTVVLVDSQQRTFSILGNAVARPSRYLIPRYDFRLTDALATAGAQMQFNVSAIYVSRRGESAAGPAAAAAPKPAPELNLVGPASKTQSKAPGPPSPVPGPPSRREIREPSQPAQRFESEREMLDLIAPHANSAWPRSERLAAPMPHGGAPGDITASVLSGDFHVMTPPAPPLVARESSHNRWRPSDEPRATNYVQTPVEFGHLNPGVDPRDLASRSAPPKPKERTEWIFRDGRWVAVVISDGQSRPSPAPGANEPPAAQPGPGGGIEWVLRDGRWAPVLNGETQAAKPPARTEPVGSSRPPAGEKLPGELEWEQAIQSRLIRIPADKLLAGDPRYNITIKPGDTIHVPVDVIGEFVIGGNVNRSGYIDITGRPMTLKMAIEAAGGLGPLAWPKNVEVVRRIGTAREEIVMVDLDRIASGEQPDFFIKPNDLIRVGTHPTARWRAVLRNAFRATYGFGFVYDRNFADIDYGTGFPWFRSF